MSQYFGNYGLSVAKRSEIYISHLRFKKELRIQENTRDFIPWRLTGGEETVEVPMKLHEMQNNYCFFEKLFKTSIKRKKIFNKRKRHSSLF